MFTFTRKMIIPRISRRDDEDLEKFIVKKINNELEKFQEGDSLDILQMQFFFESLFDDSQFISDFLKENSEK